MDHPELPSTYLQILGIKDKYFTEAQMCAHVDADRKQYRVTIEMLQAQVEVLQKIVNVQSDRAQRTAQPPQQSAWQPMWTVPIGEYVLVWHPGSENGDDIPHMQCARVFIEPYHTAQTVYNLWSFGGCSNGEELWCGIQPTAWRRIPEGLTSNDFGPIQKHPMHPEAPKYMQVGETIYQAHMQMDGSLMTDWIPLHSTEPRMLIEPDAKDEDLFQSCRVYWGSHGCDRPRGHEGPHVCLDCLTDNDGNMDWESYVGMPPYYGPDTHFYGEDFVTQQSAQPVASWQWQMTPLEKDQQNIEDDGEGDRWSGTTQDHAALVEREFPGVWKFRRIIDGPPSSVEATQPVEVQRVPLTDGAKEFNAYLKDCDECSIQPDTAGAFHAGWLSAHGIKPTSSEGGA